VNYGKSFELVDSRLEPDSQDLILWPLFQVGNQDKNLVS